VERLTFHAEDTGYTVARLKVPSELDLVTIVGSFPNIQPGQTLQLQGNWRSHPKYGDQFQVTSYKETKPATLTGMEKYLGSGLIKGVGPVTAKRIVAHFGLDTIEVIETQIERLHEVPGIARKRIQMIQSAWEAQKAIKEVMLFLQSHGVSTTYAVKIYKQYGNDSITTVTENPYKLATEVYGIGFITADAIARNIGFGIDSEFRFKAGIVHALDQAGEEGHCYLPRPELADRAVKLLSVADYQPNPEEILTLVDQMSLAEQLVMQGDSEGQFICYKPTFFYTETKLAANLVNLTQRQIKVDQERVSNWIDRFTAKTGLQLSQQQRQAVVLSASSPVLVLTGGPGTGKTFTTRTIVALWKAMGKRIMLAAPTGRAAQRLKEMTQQEAKTIHRLLEFDPKSMSFSRNDDNPLEADAVVIDEASMLDLFLAGSLIKAIPTDAQLLLVGDIDQLPSVGPGNVLRDLIASKLVPVITLTEVFRQAQTSQIVQNAHRINKGIYPKLEPVSDQPKTDCLLLSMDSSEGAALGICDVVQYLLPKLGFNAINSAQVLCPMTRGDVGTRQLNEKLQQLLNPPRASKPEIRRGSMTLRVGDRVMQKVNDYDRDVFNGDSGTITDINLEELEVTVTFSEKTVTYDSADLNEISLAWAISIHKSQGSEYPVVIMPICMQHYIMLNRNLIYTGLTRAKQLAVIVGDKKSLSLAVRQIKDQNRYTYLDRRLAKSLLEVEL
jgi:exodeoxyribonuclease V alpha subunit